MNAAEVRAIILRFLDSKAVDAWGWDDFTSTRLTDRFLDAVRIICLLAPEQYPSRLGSGRYCNDQGEAVMRHLAEHLP